MTPSSNSWPRSKMKGLEVGPRVEAVELVVAHEAARPAWRFSQASSGSSIR